MHPEITKVRIILVVTIAVLFAAAAADLYHQTVMSSTVVKGAPDVAKNITDDGTYLDTTDLSGYKTSGLSFRSAFLAMVAFFLLGALITSLVYEHRPFMRETPSNALVETADTNPDVPEQNKEDDVRDILRVLKGNERKVVDVLLGTEALNQAELATITEINKSTLSRTLHDMEQRGMIVRYENGMSKMVKLADSFER